MSLTACPQRRSSTLPQVEMPARAQQPAAEPRPHLHTVCRSGTSRLKLQAAWGWQYFATRQAARPRQSPWVLSGQIPRQDGHENRVGERERVRESVGEHERAKVSLFSRFALTCWLLEAEHSEHVGFAPKNTPLPMMRRDHDHFFPQKKRVQIRESKTEVLSKAREARAREWAEDGSRSGPRLARRRKKKENDEKR